MIKKFDNDIVNIHWVFTTNATEFDNSILVVNVHQDFTTNVVVNVHQDFTTNVPQFDITKP